jgi:enoyl-CoA hydratase
VNKTTVNLEKSESTTSIVLVPAEARKPPVLDHSVLDQFDVALDQLEVDLRADYPPRVVILKSVSARFFCAGGNIAALSTLDAESMGSWIERGHEVFARIEMLPVPTIAIVSGYALGGGLELALTCDLIYATDSAQFGQTEVRLGFVTGWGGGRRLAARVGVARAKELSFTGRMFDAAEAFRIGLAQFVGTDDELAQHIRRVVDEIGQGAPMAVNAMKEIIDAETGADPPTAEAKNLTLERAHSVSLVESEETVRRVSEFLDRR